MNFMETIVVPALSAASGRRRSAAGPTSNRCGWRTFPFPIYSKLGRFGPTRRRPAKRFLFLNYQVRSAPGPGPAIQADQAKTRDIRRLRTRAEGAPRQATKGNGWFAVAMVMGRDFVPVVKPSKASRPGWSSWADGSGELLRRQSISRQVQKPLEWTRPSLSSIRKVNPAAARLAHHVVRRFRRFRETDCSINSPGTTSPKPNAEWRPRAGSEHSGFDPNGGGASAPKGQRRPLPVGNTARPKETRSAYVEYGLCQAETS